MGGQVAANRNKTRPTGAGVDTFLDAVENERRREDARTVKAMMERITGWEPRMWGPSIVGFGEYHYRYESGREGDFLITGFSPRKKALTIYIMPGFARYDALMARLGKFRTGRSCLYINKLDDVDLSVLEELIASSVQYMVGKYGVT
ncbi:MAG: DUF1801 domain-containing protein [Gammaproteobacteria bacterium]|nr:DUF1801 domain-containing protein [Gammaproteobacteria bacterium]